MKKISIHIYIVLGLLIVGFVLGSIFDEQLSQAIFSRNNTFGLVISAIGTIPGYGILAVLGGSSLFLALKRFEKIYMKIIFIVLALATFGCSLYFSGREFFGPNGFSEVAPVWVGYLIALPIMGGLGFLGYILGQKSDNDRLWLVIVILAIAIFLALVPGVTLLKAIFHRPRYRMITSVEMQSLDLVGFHKWWVPCKDYKDIIKQYNFVYGEGALISEEFKSFPSGHAGASAVFMMFALGLPAFNKKWQKFQLPLFYGGLVWCLFVSFTRILVGAHFLSDVSMGAMLTIIFIIGAYFALYKSKWFAEYFKEQPSETESI